MEPITIMLFAFGMISTGSIDLVMDEESMVDGFIYYNDRVIELDTWKTTNNPDRYYGKTTDGDSFYMLISETQIKVKIWSDKDIRIIEQYQ